MPARDIEPIAAENALKVPKGMLIGGTWREAVSGKSFDVQNPATGKVIAQVPLGDRADVDLAVAAARASFDSGVWRKMRSADRAEIMWRFTDIVLAHLDEMAAIETADNGMPLSHAVNAIKAGVTTFRYYAGMCTKIYGKTSEISSHQLEYHAYSLAEPVGVAGLITPWNGPFATVCNKAGPALAAGCSIILKPAEQSPLTALKFAEFAQEAGFPDGVVNIVTGYGESAGAALVEHPDVDKISFTGSTEVGRLIVQAASLNFKRLSLELGGKSPVFLFDDADLELAIPAAAMGIFRNSGQVCFAGSRLFVQRGIVDQVAEGIAAFARKLRIGNGTEPGVEVGPMISDQQRARVLGYVESGIEDGAELLTGGQAMAGPGFFMEPTVFVNTRPEMKMVREEIFGPVLAVAPFDGIDDVERLGNATPYGLGAGIYTQDVSKTHRVAKMLRAGNVWVNCYGFTDKTLPFGGYKQSGWGREGAQEGIDAFLEKKTVYVRL